MIQHSKPSLSSRAKLCEICKNGSYALRVLLYQVLTSESDGEVSSRAVSTLGESSLWVFCSPWSCNNHVSLQVALRFQQCSGYLFGKGFCSGFEGASHQDILSAEHSMTRRHLARGTLVLPTCCFKGANLSARRA